MTLPSDISSLHKLIHDLMGKLTILEEENASLKQTVSLLSQSNQELQDQVKDLKSQLNKNSGNSSKPPSSDGLRKKPAFPKPKGGKKGGKQGHKGSTLDKITTPDQIQECKVDSCECGYSFLVSDQHLHSTRQVFDLPEPKLEVTEYHLYQSTCPCCGQISKGAFPPGVEAPTQYGDGVRSFCVLLNNHYKLPFNKVSDLFNDMFGYRINEATVSSANQNCFEKLTLTEQIIKDAVLQSDVVGSDESGVRVEGSLHWLHVGSTQNYTYLFIHKKRGNEAMNSTFSFLPSYTGTLVHDCLPAYFKFEQFSHALCGAHLLREMEALIEQGSLWAKDFSNFLRCLLKIPYDRRSAIKKLIEGRYWQLCQKADAEEPPPKKTKTRDKCTKGRNLLRRLIKYKEAVLAFAFNEQIPFTNNLAERDVRPVKIKQKVSNSFRTLHGARIYARIESFISTARKQGQNIFKELKNTFCGHNFLTAKIYVT